MFYVALNVCLKFYLKLMKKVEDRFLWGQKFKMLKIVLLLASQIPNWPEKL